MIRFTCPRCAAALKAAAARAGHTLPCPKCRRPVAVPRPPDDGPPEVERNGRGSHRTIPARAWAALAGGVLAAVVAVVLIARPGREPVAPTASQPDMSTDEGKSKWLVGRWYQQGHEAPVEFVFEASGQFTETLPAGDQTVYSKGAWWIEKGRLVLRYRESSHPFLGHVGAELTYEMSAPTPNAFVLRSQKGGTPFARKR